MKYYFTQRAAGVVLLAVLWFTVLFYSIKRPEPVVQTKQVVIYKEPTDEQLVNWWFGNGDKAKLRERICK